MLLVGDEAHLEIQLSLEVSLNNTTHLAARPESRPKYFFLGFYHLNSFIHRALAVFVIGPRVEAFRSGSSLDVLRFGCILKAWGVSFSLWFCV